MYLNEVELLRYYLYGMGSIYLIFGLCFYFSNYTFSDNHYEKLRKKYGDIDKSKLIKLDNMTKAIMGLGSLIVGILENYHKDKNITFITLCIVLVMIAVVYSLYRRKLINKMSNKN